MEERNKRIDSIKKYSENKLSYDMEIDSVEIILNHKFTRDSKVNCPLDFFEGQITSYKYNNLIYNFRFIKSSRRYALLKNILKNCW